MKLKLSLQRSELPPVDLVATVDGATTVGDLADYLSHSDPRRTGVPDLNLTLGVVGDTHRALDRRMTLAESGVTSGSTVTLSRPGADFQDPQDEPDAVVEVVAGPDAGRTFELRRGANVIGREAGCEIRLTDPLISRQHARVNVTDIAEIVDLGSANGIIVDGTSVTRAIVRPDDTVMLGDSTIRVQVRVHRPSLPGVETTSDAFVRPPRLDPHFEGQTFKAPEPPEAPEPPRFPFIALIAPLIVGAVLFAITKSAVSLAFIALSPLMLVGNSIESRVTGKKAFKKALALWRSDVGELVDAVTAAAVEEVVTRDHEHPSVAVCLEAARTKSSLLWARRPEDPGFIELRLGTGQQASRSTIELPDNSRGPRELVQELAATAAPLARVAPVPIVAAPAEHGAIGVAGERRSLLGVARGFMAQVAVLHSPAELVVTGFASSGSAGDWDWLKWLPHTTSPHSPLSTRHLVSNTGAANALISELEALLAKRQGGDEEPSLPVVCVLVEDDAPVEHSRLVELAEAGWQHGIIVLWLASSVGNLPASCRSFVDVEAASGHGAVGFVHSANLVQPVELELATAEAVMDLARRLAPMIDIGARIDDDSDLPRAVSLLTLTGPALAADPDSVVERWNENRSIMSGPCAPDPVPRRTGTLRAVIGQSAGEPIALDLRADGPHALVGGTTGSGKSELLQTWILAMAAAHSPQRLTFLLVDYKGGSAFRDCTELPHTVGLVTDLSPYLVRRALTSLKAELRFRERVLAQHAAKDLATLEKMGVVDAPPSLVIVVDEFAALVNEVPEFVDGVVDVAQRGRSLGLHLILATQRPAGVIKDNLRANTNLRLALRMADEADSADVLDSPQAAYFDQAIPGRAVSKTGPGRLVPFQAAYSGGWTTDEPPAPEMVVEELTFGAGRVWEIVDEAEPLPGDESATDIKRLVRSVRGAAEHAQIAQPRKPWLPELRAVYDLADQASVPSRRTDTELVFGVSDDPGEQRQPTVAFQPDRDGNLAVYGTGGSGKSTLLRTMAIAAGFTVRGGPCHVYGLDFGAHGLAMLEALPHVGSIIDGADHERITRVLGWLRDLVDERALRYSRANASTITEYRRLADVPDEPRILLLVDGIATFRHAYEATDRVRWFELFTSLATDGRPVGIHVVLSSDQRTGMTTALASAVQSRVVLRMADEDEYGMLNVPSDVLTSHSAAGRGLVGDTEVQIAVLGGTSDVVDQAVAIEGFAQSMVRAGGSTAQAIEQLAQRVMLEQLPVGVDGPVIGLASSTLGPFSIEPRGTFIVTGPPGSGRTTTLLGMVESLRRWDPTIALHYFGNRRSPLSALDVWESVATSPDDIAEQAATLAAQLAGSNGSSGRTAVVVEGIGELSGGLAEMALQDLVKVCIAEDHFALLEGETSTLSSSFGLLGTAKSSRAGLALSPDQADGMTVYRTDFPRTNRAEFPPGRALHVALGRTEVIQVALPTS